VSASIRERLGMITGAELAAAAPPPATRVPEQLHAAGWREIAPYVHVRDGEADVPARVAGADAASQLLPVECRVGDCLFWDTETTGLAGAGTVIFLVGCAWVDGPRVRVRQVFLADFPGEQQFLEHLRDLFSRFQVFVSYNGKAFDSTILKTRLVMSGVTMALGYQLDLLYLARRFWRRLLDNCRLTTIEQEVLGVQRGDDIPGWMAPEIYFDSLRRGVLGQLPAVFEHNEADVLALVHLLAVVNGVLAGDANREPALGVDRGAVGSFLLQQGDRRGARMLRQAYRGGDQGAGHLLGLHLKRASDWRSAVSLWQDMVRVHGSLHAAVELSKYYEHRTRDLPAALASIAPFLPSRGDGAPGAGAPGGGLRARGAGAPGDGMPARVAGGPARTAGKRAGTAIAGAAVDAGKPTGADGDCLAARGGTRRRTESGEEGCTAARMQTEFHHGLLSPGELSGLVHREARIRAKLRRAAAT